MECVDDRAVKVVRALLPLLAELLLMQLAYFVVPNSHGAATLTSKRCPGNDLGSCNRAKHFFTMCFRPEEKKPRHDLCVGAEMRVKEGGVGASLAWAVEYCEPHKQKCTCSECINLDCSLPENRAGELAKEKVAREDEGPAKRTRGQRAQEDEGAAEARSCSAEKRAQSKKPRSGKWSCPYLN